MKCGFATVKMHLWYSEDSHKCEVKIPAEPVVKVSEKSHRCKVKIPAELVVKVNDYV